jgi:hypothetical protein
MINAAEAMNGNGRLMMPPGDIQRRIALKLNFPILVGIPEENLEKSLIRLYDQETGHGVGLGLAIQAE